MPELKAKPVRASLTYLSDLMSPPDANAYGSVFGGKILAMIDKAAAVCAMRHAAQPCVTVAMDRVEFMVPIFVTDLVTVEARINYAGKTSMEIGVEVFSENMAKGTRVHTNACLVTMVAVTKDRKPARVPGLILETPGDKSRYAAAVARRKARSRA